MSTNAVIARIFKWAGFALAVVCLGVGYFFAAVPLGLAAAALPSVFMMGPGFLVSHFDKRSKKQEATNLATHEADSPPNTPFGRVDESGIVWVEVAPGIERRYSGYDSQRDNGTFGPWNRS